MWECKLNHTTLATKMAVIRLSLRAWTPVFDSIQNAMSADVYQAFYPNHWRVSQQKAVEDVCAAQDTNVWVAICADARRLANASQTQQRANTAANLQASRSQSLQFV